MIVVSDSRPLISLMKAARLDLLRDLYGEIRILLLGFDKRLLTVQEVDAALGRMKGANRRISEELYQYAREYVRR